MWGRIKVDGASEQAAIKLYRRELGTQAYFTA